MIRFMQGDMLDAETEALVNTVNCVGIMGRGIALHFKNKFPDNFKAYAGACDRQEVQPGRMFVYETNLLTNPRYIINFPTKRHWREKSRIEDIEAGLNTLVEVVQSLGIRSIAIPPLGAGLGGLDWQTVRHLIERTLVALPDVDVLVYEPSAEPVGHIVNTSNDIPKMTAGRAALVGLMDRYLAALLDIDITLLEVHKLMYFLQVSGEPLRLRYVKAPYGPYAVNMRHVLKQINGHLIYGYSDNGDAPGERLHLTPGAVKDAQAFLSNHPQTHERFDRVVRLVEGFETAFGLELLSTVHWVSKEACTLDLSHIQQGVYAWAPTKAQFTPTQIALALRTLGSLGWLSEPHLKEKTPHILDV